MGEGKTKEEILRPYSLPSKEVAPDREVKPGEAIASDDE